MPNTPSAITTMPDSAVTAAWNTCLTQLQQQTFKCTERRRLVTELFDEFGYRLIPCLLKDLRHEIDMDREPPFDAVRLPLLYLVSLIGPGMKETHSECGELLRSGLRSKHKTTRLAALFALSEIGVDQDSLDAIRSLIKPGQEKSSTIFILALKTLEMLQERAAAALPELLLAIEPTQIGLIRRGALTVISAIGANAAPALPILISLVQTETDVSLQTAGLLGIVKISDRSALRAHLQTIKVDSRDQLTVRLIVLLEQVLAGRSGLRTATSVIKGCEHLVQDCSLFFRVLRAFHSVSSGEFSRHLKQALKQSEILQRLVNSAVDDAIHSPHEFGNAPHTFPAEPMPHPVQAAKREVAKICSELSELTENTVDVVRLIDQEYKRAKDEKDRAHILKLMAKAAVVPTASDDDFQLVRKLLTNAVEDEVSNGKGWSIGMAAVAGLRELADRDPSVFREIATVARTHGHVFVRRDAVSALMFIAQQMRSIDCESLSRPPFAGEVRKVLSARGGRSSGRTVRSQFLEEVHQILLSEMRNEAGKKCTTVLRNCCRIIGYFPKLGASTLVCLEKLASCGSDDVKTTAEWTLTQICKGLKISRAISRHDSHTNQEDSDIGTEADIMSAHTANREAQSGGADSGRTSRVEQHIRRIDERITAIEQRLDEILGYLRGAAPPEGAQVLIEQLRQRSWTLKEIAAEIGLSESQLSRIAAGRSQIQRREFMALRLIADKILK